MHGGEVQLGELRFKLVSFARDGAEPQARAGLPAASATASPACSSATSMLKALDEEAAFSDWVEAPLTVARYELRGPNRLVSDRPTILEMLALRRTATRVVELTDMLLLSLIAVTAGRTGPLRFCVAMVGPGLARGAQPRRAGRRPGAGHAARGARPRGDDRSLRGRGQRPVAGRRVNGSRPPSDPRPTRARSSGDGFPTTDPPPRAQLIGAVAWAWPSSRPGCSCGAGHTLRPTRGPRRRPRRRRWPSRTRAPPWRLLDAEAAVAGDAVRGARPGLPRQGHPQDAGRAVRPRRRRRAGARAGHRADGVVQLVVDGRGHHRVRGRRELPAPKGEDQLAPQRAARCATARSCGACASAVREAMDAVPLDGADHEHARYRDLRHRHLPRQDPRADRVGIRGGAPPRIRRCLWPADATAVRFQVAECPTASAASSSSIRPSLLWPAPASRPPRRTRRRPLPRRVRRLRHLRSPRGRQHDLPRPARAAAPRARVGRHRHERRRAALRAPRDGPRAGRLHAGAARQAARAASPSGTSATRRPAARTSRTRSPSRSTTRVDRWRSATTAT